MKTTVSTESGAPDKTFGLLEGKIEVPDDFNAPLPEDVLEAFEAARVAGPEIRAHEQRHALDRA